MTKTGNTSHLLRTDGGGSVGFGHVKRCLSLASLIRERGGQPEIVLGISDEHVLTRINDAGYPCRRLDKTKMFDPQETLRDARHAIFDFTHLATRGQVDKVERLFANLQGRGVRTLLIDSHGRDCLSSARNMRVDVLAIPYVGAEEETVLPGAAKDVRGPGYFVLDSTYLADAGERRQTRSCAKNVLVTAGGSDPTDLTLLFLDALSMVEGNLEVRIVIGPAYPAARAAKISARARALCHETKLVEAPSSLSGEMQRTDLALTASGLTKYELAFMATPAILVSIDKNHADANRSFAALHCAVDMGTQETVSAHMLADAVQNLIDDEDQRRTFAITGPTVIDGRGTQRLLDLLDG